MEQRSVSVAGDHCMLDEIIRDAVGDSETRPVYIDLGSNEGSK